jgi:UDP-2-acetamido-2,6-beta-L-arabino-hexul-4-ose reductase
MRIAVTGARGFVARNLIVRLRELGEGDIVQISHDISDVDLVDALDGVELVYHLSGVNRPRDPSEFATGNIGFTERLCAALARAAPEAAIAFSSSTQAALDNDYGRSKRAAEDMLVAHGEATGASVSLFRLTNIFGKWSRPNYNSAVATFCYNIARDWPISIGNPDAPLKLIYIDDVVECLLTLLAPANRVNGLTPSGPEYDSTVGAVADIIRSFRNSRASLVTPPVGTGLIRALYSTYVAAFDPDNFVYDVPMYSDPRGVFCEMLKTPDCGQFSFFTAHPNITRGEHYHHSKTEKFLVIKGTAHFGFRHIESGVMHEIVTSGDKAQIVETVPGWTHNITNIGDDEMIVMLWANEIFDRDRPDTIGMKVNP